MSCSRRTYSDVASMTAWSACKPILRPGDLAIWPTISESDSQVEVFSLRAHLSKSGDDPSTPATGTGNGNGSRWLPRASQWRSHFLPHSPTPLLTISAQPHGAWCGEDLSIGPAGALSSIPLGFNDFMLQYVSVIRRPIDIFLTFHPRISYSHGLAQRCRIWTPCR
jgi:hypothetical protein